MEMRLERIVCTCFLDLSVATSVWSLASSTSTERTQAFLLWSKVFAPSLRVGSLPCAFFSPPVFPQGKCQVVSLHLRSLYFKKRKLEVCTQKWDSCVMWPSYF